MDFSIDKKLQGFQLIAQEKLQAIICSIPGKKDLIIEQNLIRPLERVCNAAWLRLKGIQRIYKYEDASNVHIPRGNDQIQLIMIRSNLKTFKRVLLYINAIQEAMTEIDISFKKFHIICVPSCFCYFHNLLEEEGLYGHVQLYRYNWDFICLDQGVLSLEIPNVFSTVFYHKDTSLLPSIAHSLRILQMITGKPDLLITYGEHASNIVKMLETLGPWEKKANSGSNIISADFAAMFIIDRDRDYASSLLSPAIYAGLLLEVFQQNSGEIDISVNTNKILSQKLPIFMTQQEKIATTAAEKKDDKLTKSSNKTLSIMRLSSLNDEIYGENCYKHFSQASSMIRAQAKSIGLEMQKLSNMKLNEMHEYVARKLPKTTELKTKLTQHLKASEKIIEMLAGNFQKVQSIEEDILNNVARKRIINEIDEMLPTVGLRYNILRQLCLLHLCAGVAVEEMLLFIRNYCNFFGVQYLQMFQQLAKAGLLPSLPEDEKINKSTKLLSNLSLPKFPNQTEFQANANRLKLLVSPPDKNDTSTNSANKVDKMNPTCPSYVFNGIYIPLAAQLCNFLLKSVNAEDFSNKLTMMDKILIHTRSATAQTYTAPFNAKVLANNVKQNECRDPFPLRNKNIFVYILGGVTYAEISACNLVARLTGAKIVVASDYIVSGTDLMASAL